MCRVSGAVTPVKRHLRQMIVQIATDMPESPKGKSYTKSSSWLCLCRLEKIRLANWDVTIKRLDGEDRVVAAVGSNGNGTSALDDMSANNHHMMIRYGPVDLL